MEANGNVQQRDIAAMGFAVRRVPLDAPFEWLARGWQDVCAVPSVSLAYGALFTFVAWFFVFGLSVIDATSASGFVLLGPLLAAGMSKDVSESPKQI